MELADNRHMQLEVETQTYITLFAKTFVVEHTTIIL